MKIYPAEHNIKVITSKTLDLDLNVPLAYVNTETKTYDMKYNVSSEFSKSSMTEILPGQEFDDVNIKAFNKMGEEVDISNMLIRNGDKYIYQPENVQKFIPQTFLYKATIKRESEYKTNKSYNINASCIDDPDSLDLSQRLADVLINPSDRNLLPPNISINKDRNNISAITTGSLKDTDFVFIESYDGVNYDDSLENPIDIHKFLDSHTNIWLGMDFSDDFELKELPSIEGFELQKPILLSNKKILSKTCIDFRNMFAADNIRYHNIFVGDYIPVIIKEYMGKGFVIMSSNIILKNPREHAGLIYEVMAYCYFNSYNSTDYIKEWITDAVPDYQIVNKTLSRKNDFVSSLNLYNHFKLKNDEMTLYNVDIEDDPNNYRTVTQNSNTDLEMSDSMNITYKDFKSGYISFKKIESRTVNNLKDPEKPRGWISLYDGSEIIYMDNIYYLIDESLESKIFLTEEGDNLKIKIAPFKKSLMNINFTNPNSLTIPFFKTEDGEIIKIRSANYYIYLDNGFIEFCDELDYKEEIGALMFVINISQDTDKTTIFDMRQLGGGLPEDLEDDFELLDIGHINGRPYRPHGTTVITLPTKYEKHKDLILKAINKFIAADEYPVIFFEDKEE